MKAATLFLCLYIALSCFTNAHAQLSSSREPRGETDHQTGEIIILPAESVKKKKAEVVKKVPGEVVFRNVAQKRQARNIKHQNGYHEMTYGQDWGASARINRYDYAIKPSSTSAAETGLAETPYAEAISAHFLAAIDIMLLLASSIGTMSPGQFSVTD